MLIRSTPLKLLYFPLWAKGPGPALALQHANMPFKHIIPEDWPTYKQETSFSKLPILESNNGLSISHEGAILNYIGQQQPAMHGKSESDFAISQQLICESEDIYGKLTKYVLTPIDGMYRITNTLQNAGTSQRRTSLLNAAKTN